MAKAAQGKKAEGNGAADKMDAKLLTGRFFMERLMPETAARLALHHHGRGHDHGDAGGGVLTTKRHPGRSAGIASRRKRPILNDDSGPLRMSGMNEMPWEASMAEAFIYDAVRTPRGRGKPDGSLHEVPAVDLAVTTLDAIRSRNDLDPMLVEDVVLGCVDPVGEAGGDIARAAALKAGFGKEVPGVQINRFCASGLDAVNLAAAQVMAGMKDIAIGGGVESMSRIGMGASGGAWPVDPGIAIPNYFLPQGISADLIATKYGFSRDDVDAYAVEVAEARREGLGRGALRQVRRSGEGHQRPDHPRQGRAHAAADRHAVARPAQGRLRADGRDGRLRCGGDRGASGCGVRQSRPPCGQLVGHRRWRCRRSRRQRRRAARRRA